MKQCDGDRWQMRAIWALQPTPITLSLGWVFGTVAPFMWENWKPTCCVTPLSLPHTISKLCCNKIESQLLSSCGVGYTVVNCFMLFSCLPLFPLPVKKREMNKIQSASSLKLIKTCSFKTHDSSGNVKRKIFRTFKHRPSGDSHISADCLSQCTTLQSHETPYWENL